MDKDLEAEIRRAFHQSEVPVRPPYFLNYSSDISSDRYWEGIEETEDFWGKDWPELTWENFHMNRGVFSFLPSDVLPYFFGAAMVLSLKQNGEFPDALGMYFSTLSVPVTKKRKGSTPHLHAWWFLTSQTIKNV